LSLAAVVALFGQTARADEIKFVSVTEFSELEAKMASFETRLDEIALGGDAACQKATQKGDCYDMCCHTPGLTGYAEVVFLSMYDNEDYTTDAEAFKEGYRVAVGYRFAGGLGLTARWTDWKFNSPEDLYKIYFIDLELNDVYKLCGKANVVLAGGVRYGHQVDEGYDESFYGIGPYLGVQLNRAICCNTSLYMMGRQSLLYGAEVQDDEPGTTSITEIQLGAEFRRCMGGTQYFFTRVGCEGQYWHAISEDDNQDWSLVGFMCAVGVDR
jgi:hypothetical protein